MTEFLERLFKSQSGANVEVRRLRRSLAAKKFTFKPQKHGNLWLIAKKKR